MEETPQVKVAVENHSSESEEDLHSDDLDMSEIFSETEDDKDYYLDDDDVMTMSSSSQDSAFTNSSCSNKSGNKTTPISHLTRKKKIQFRKLLQHVIKLSEDLKTKQQNLIQARESLSQCRTVIQDLDTQYQQTNKDMKIQGNVPSMSLMNDRIKRLLEEISRERQKENQLIEDIRKLELSVAESELAYSQYDEIKDETEAFIKQQNQKQVMFRVQSQTRQLIEVQRYNQLHEKMKFNLVREKEEEVKIVMEKMKQAQKNGRKFLHETSERKKAKETIDEENHRIYLENRMKSLLSLKNNIKMSRSALEAQQLLEKERQRKIAQVEEEERMHTIKIGDNPDEVILRRKQMKHFENEKQKFEQKQKKSQLSIVSRLVEEEKIKKREETRLGQSHWQSQIDTTPTKQVNNHWRKKKKHRTSDSSQNYTITTNEANEQQRKINENEEEEKEKEKEKVIMEEEETLVSPDIPGLWKNVTKNNKKETIVKMSKMEKQIMEQTMEKLKRSAVIKQITAGREFKGQAFISKPEEVVFKDFQVGKTYRKRLQLTNVSYTVNYCKMIGVSEHLRDFISIEFNPPGAMSAGLTCVMIVTFQPKINKDLSGSIELLSQTGSFSIPLNCYTKKSVVSVDINNVSFGSVCVGETITKVITAHNMGALPTNIRFILMDTAPTQQSSVLLPDNVEVRSQDQLMQSSQRSMLSTVEYKTDGFLAVENNLMSRSSDNIGGIDSKPLDMSPIFIKEMKIEEVPLETEQVKGKKSSSLKVFGTKNVDNRQDVVSTEIPEVHIETPESQLGINEREVVVTRCESTVSFSNTQKLPMAIKTGKNSSGCIKPYSSLFMELIFSPEIPGDYNSQFELCTNQPLSEPIIITASGKGIEVPIYVEEETIDLRICMTDRLYQDSVVLHNRSSIALQATFNIPPSLGKYLEILPKHGLVQGESCFAAQLKFLPTNDIYKECSKYISNEEPHLMEVPVNISVTGQTSSVPFFIKSIVTSSDIELSKHNIEFGQCTIHESVITSINITNKCCLPQDYGFVHLPKWITVQPNDGFGTLLPHETVSVDVIFSPDRACEYNTKIICKTGIDKDYKISVNGIGILPGLKLSQTAITFKATPLGTTSYASLNVHNSRLSRMDSAVIRGVAPPQCTKMFEFCVPKDIPITISPHVGIVKPGESIRVDVAFHPNIDSEVIKQKGLKMAALMQKEVLESTTDDDREEKKEVQKNKSQPSRSALSGRGSVTSRSKGSITSPGTGSHTQTENEDVIKTTLEPSKGSELWWKAYNSILNDYDNNCNQWSIPCFISNNVERNEVLYRCEETLYLEITATTIKPSLVISSDIGSNNIEFNEVGIGDNVLKTVVLKNISLKPLKLCCSPLDPNGVFEMRNALRDIPPNGSHSMILKFTPDNTGKFYENLQIYYNASSYLELIITGIGIDPTVELVPKEGLIDWGHVMSGDVCTQTLQLHNPSQLTVKYKLVLECLEYNSKFKSVSNHNGQPPFTCIPNTGKILPDSSIDVSIEFSPDHSSLFFNDILHVDINSKRIQSLQLKGCSWTTNMFVLGGLELVPELQSMEALPVIQSGTGTQNSLPILVILKHNLSNRSSTTEHLHIGCIKTTLVKKSSGEFVIEPLQQSNTKCITIDPMKSIVEAGSSRDITITFIPPQQITSNVIEADTNIILKGDIVSQQKLLIRVVLYD